MTTLPSTTPWAGALAVGADGGDPKSDENQRGAEPRWVRWQLSTGAVVEVSGVAAYAVDATGAVSGTVRTGAPPTSGTAPARWRDGTVAELPGPGGTRGTGGVTATSHDGGRLVGWTGDVDAPVATVWTC